MLYKPLVLLAACSTVLAAPVERKEAAPAANPEDMSVAYAPAYYYNYNTGAKRSEDADASVAYAPAYYYNYNTGAKKRVAEAEERSEEGAPAAEASA